MDVSKQGENREPRKLTTYETHFRGDDFYNGEIPASSLETYQTRIPISVAETVIPLDRLQYYHKLNALNDVYQTTYNKSHARLNPGKAYVKKTSLDEAIEDSTTAKQLKEYEVKRSFQILDERARLLYSPYTATTISKIRKRFQFCHPENIERWRYRDLLCELSLPAKERFPRYDRSPAMGCEIQKDIVKRKGNCKPYDDSAFYTYDFSMNEINRQRRKQLQQCRPTDAEIHFLQTNMPLPIWLQGARQTPWTMFHRDGPYPQHTRKIVHTFSYMQPSNFDRENLIAEGIIPLNYPHVPMRIPHLATLPKAYEKVGPLHLVPLDHWDTWKLDEFYKACNK